MHGHGIRPHLCPFGDCKRAVYGHGFRRQNNLSDHLWRLHKYKSLKTKSVTSVQVIRKSVTRMRKVNDEETKGKRHKAARYSVKQSRKQAYG
jgi:hypothetical protein